MNVVKNRDQEVKDSIAMAKEVMANLGRTFLRMQRDEIIVDVPLIQNQWLPLPDSMSSKGVLTSLIVPPASNPKVNIVYIPAGGEVKVHWHNEEQESIRVISGKVHFKIYASRSYDIVLISGTLEEGEDVMIEPLKAHYVFTSDVDAYLKIKFLKV